MIREHGWWNAEGGIQHTTHTQDENVSARHSLCQSAEISHELKISVEKAVESVKFDGLHALNQDCHSGTQQMNS